MELLSIVGQRGSERILLCVTPRPTRGVKESKGVQGDAAVATDVRRLKYRVLEKQAQNKKRPPSLSATPVQTSSRVQHYRGT